jgi:hypothetical protein
MMMRNKPLYICRRIIFVFSNVDSPFSNSTSLLASQKRVAEKGNMRCDDDVRAILVQVKNSAAFLLTS